MSIVLLKEFICSIIIFIKWILHSNTENTPYFRARVSNFYARYLSFFFFFFINTDNHQIHCWNAFGKTRASKSVRNKRLWRRGRKLDDPPLTMTQMTRGNLAKLSRLLNVTRIRGACSLRKRTLLANRGNHSIIILCARQRDVRVCALIVQRHVWFTLSRCLITTWPCCFILEHFAWFLVTLRIIHRECKITRSNVYANILRNYKLHVRKFFSLWLIHY